MRVLRRCFEAFCALSFALSPIARAQDGPVIGYAPQPDVYAPSADCVVPPSAIELDFASNCTPGTPCTVTATPQTSQGVTTVACSISRLSGDGTLSLTQSPLQFTFGPDYSPRTFTVGCTPGSVDTTGQVCCQETRGFDKARPVFDVSCPRPSAPRFDSTPAIGTTLLLRGPSGTTAQTTVLVRNIGETTLMATPSLTGPFTVAPAGTSSLGPGSAQTFTISCVTAADPATGALRFETNDPTHQTPATAIDFPLQCQTTTTAPPPAPRFVNDPPATIFTTTGAQGSAPLLVRNTGNATLVISSASGLSAPFAIVPGSQDIVAGGSFAFTVSCNGNAPGTFSDTVLFGTNDPAQNPATVGVACVLTEPGAPSLATEPTAPGPIPLAATQGGAAATAPLLVRNIGTAPLSATSVAFLVGSSTNLSVTPASAANIPPNDQRQFTVSCATAVAGQFGGTLRVSSNAGNADLNVSCGVNAAPAPRYGSSPAPGSTITFTTTQTTPATRTVALQNLGTATLSITSLTGPTGPQITRSSVALPLTIAPGQQFALTLTCVNATGGTFQDLLTIASNDASTPSASYPLTCNVSGPPPQAQFAAQPPAPGPLSFDTQRDTPQSNTVVVSNGGNAALSISAITGLQPPFSVAPAGATILPGASGSFVFTCAATAIGQFTSAVAFQTNAPGATSVPFNLGCLVRAPDPTVTFALPYLYDVGTSPRGLVVGDLNADSFLDLAVANSGSNSVSVLRGAGNGGFRPRTNHIGGPNPGSVALGFINNDNFLDIVAGDNLATSVRQLLSNPAGTSYVSTPISPWAPWAMVLPSQTSTTASSISSRPNEARRSFRSAAAWRTSSATLRTVPSFRSRFPAIRPT